MTDGPEYIIIDLNGQPVSLDRYTADELETAKAVAESMNAAGTAVFVVQYDEEFDGEAADDPAMFEWFDILRATGGGYTFYCNHCGYRADGPGVPEIGVVIDAALAHVEADMFDPPADWKPVRPNA